MTPLTPTSTWLEGLSLTLIAIGQWHGNSGPVAQRILDAFLRRFPAQQRAIIWKSADARLLPLLTRGIRVADPHFASELLLGLDYMQLGSRSSHLGPGALLSFLPFASQSGVSIGNIHAFCNGFDFKALGRRYRDKSLAVTKNFLSKVLQSGVSAEHLNALIDGIDFKGLGERSRGTNIASLRAFLQFTRQAGASAKNINSFCEGFDFRRLGERSHDAGIANIRALLFEANKAGVSTENLTALCGGLDWYRLGQEVAPTVNENSPLWSFHSISFNPGITPVMARMFVEGLGWDVVRSILAAPNAPDVLAALSTLLKKCFSNDLSSLQQYGITFDSSVWLRSFVECGCGRVQPAQQGIQQIYLQTALKGLQSSTSLHLRQSLFGRYLSLRNWNILSHNIELAAPELVRVELEPLMRDISQAGWTQLIRDADLKNLGSFATMFAPGNGKFKWRPHLDSALCDPDFDAIIGPARLIELAHSLFTLRYLEKPDWCAAIAEALDRDSENVLAKMAGADLRTMDFFLWNLLTARYDLCCPTLLNSTGICNVVSAIVKKYTKEQENLVALCGTLHFFGWHGLGELTPLVNKELALTHCLEAAKLKSPKLIRLVAGLAVVAPLGLSAAAQQVVRDGLDSLAFPFEVPSQVLALKQCRTWIEAMGDT